MLRFNEYTVLFLCSLFVKEPYKGASFDALCTQDIDGMAFIVEQEKTGSCVV